MRLPEVVYSSASVAALVAWAWQGTAGGQTLAHGVEPNNLGKGDWIWQMSACQTALGVATPQAVLTYEAAKGMQWVTVKGADGGNTNSFTQFNPTLISQAHAAGLKIFAWAYCYGNSSGWTVQDEINAALTLLAEGADGFIIDAEAESEGQPAAAAQYCQAIRAQYPNTFLAHAPFPYISYHTAFPYIQFGTNCDAVMPQDYWADIGVSVGQMVSDMDSKWRTWQNGLTGVYTNAIKPIIPIGQGWDSTGYTEPAADITNFVYLLKTDANPAGRGGYHGVSFWSCQHHTAADWAGIAAVSIGTATNAPSISTQPASLEVNLGSNAVFSVIASGAGPLSYRWHFDQANVAGATSSTYTVTNAQLANAGGYSVTVTNSAGSTLSATAFLSVLAPLANAPGCILAPAGMIDWWPAEGDANDIFGPYNATPANGLSYTAGKQDLAFHFDGTSSYLSTGAPSLGSAWTVCLWVNRQNAPGTSAALLSDGTYSLKLEQYNATRKVGVTQLGVGDYTFNYVAPAGVWVHLAFVGTGAQTILYANGVSQGALTNVVPLSRAYLGATYVASGARFVDYLLAGVDEILCFNRALTGAEVSAIYSAGSAGLVRAPEFTSLSPAGGAGFLLNLRGQTGKSFTLFDSTDLDTWNSLGTLPNPTGAIQYTDPATNGPMRFYRARQP